MKIGLQVPYFTWPGGADQLGETFGAIADRADRLGFSSFWVMDHFFQLPQLGAAELDMLEGYTALAFAAARTSRIKLGTLVTGVTYRHPGVLVKTATTLDVLSGGRTYFGVGAAWFEREHLGLGVPFGTMKERFERLEEALRITHQMWSGEGGAFTGKHYQLTEAICSPAPLSKPHPPILIGGTGERKTLRLVAKYADATNMPMPFSGEGAATMRRKLEVLKQHCEREGRPYDSIEKTALSTLWLAKSPPQKGAWVTPAQALDTIQQFADAGVDQMIFNMANVDRAEALETMAEALLEPAAAF